MLLKQLFLISLHVPFGVLHGLVPKELLRRFQVLAGFVIVGGHGGPKVVALDRLVVLLKEASEPLAKGVARSGDPFRYKHHSVVRLPLLLPIGLNRGSNFRAENNLPRGALLRFELSLYKAVGIWHGLRNLSERYAYDILDAEGPLVE